MSKYTRGDVVVVLYPFTDGVSWAPRPALVVSTSKYNDETGDIVLAQITSRIGRPLAVGDYLLRDWRETNLNVQSKVRTGKLNTLLDSQVRRHLGHLSDRDLAGTEAAMRSVLEL